MSNEIIEFLSAISSISGIIAIIIVVWDHFKDDRLITKQVQEFYKDVENIIYSYYKMRITESLFDNREYLVYQGIIKQKFDDYSKYLGLTRHPSEKELFYINKADILFHHHGALMKDISDNNKGYRRVQIIEDPLNIKEEEISQINKYLESLRNYWKLNYKKRFFRPMLKAKKDFNDLINYKKKEA